MKKWEEDKFVKSGKKMIGEKEGDCKMVNYDKMDVFGKKEQHVHKEKITIRELAKKYPELYEYDYKWRDSEHYKNLNEVLEDIGYRLVEGEVKSGDYNDIKGYFGSEVEKI